jgi:hypothetical protein
VRHLSPERSLFDDGAGPQTDDELWLLVRERTGKEIPRRAVCAHHTPPFRFFADAFFGRTTSALALAPRGGAKSWMLGLLMFLRCKFTARLKALVVGSIEQQSAEVLWTRSGFHHR